MEGKEGAGVARGGALITLRASWVPIFDLAHFSLNSSLKSSQLLSASLPLLELKFR